MSDTFDRPGPEGPMAALLKPLGRFVRRASAQLLELLYIAQELVRDPKVPVRVKGPILAALAYLGLPLDAVPDFAPGGYADDLAVLVGAVALAAVYVTEEMRDGARRFAARVLGRFGLAGST